MAILSLPENFNPTIFDMGEFNCYRYFNDAFRKLEGYLESYISRRSLDGGNMNEQLNDIFNGFYTAHTIMGDDDRNLSHYRNIIGKYAFISAILLDLETAHWFYAQNSGGKGGRGGGAFQYRGTDDVCALLAGAIKAKMNVSVDDNLVEDADNLAMFAALKKNIATPESASYMKLTADDYLLRFILTSAPDDSPLIKHVGSFDFSGLPVSIVERRFNLFLGVLPDLINERYGLDTGKKHVLKVLLESCKDYAPDKETAKIYRLGYENYSGLFEGTQKILDDKAREFELYCLYGPGDEELPESRHFRGLGTGLALGDASSFNKNNFSETEIGIYENDTDDTGFLGCVLNQMYHVKPVKDFIGAKRIKFVFENYPGIIYADFAQFAETAVNYFWLPEAPVKILNHDGTEFCGTEQVSKYKTRKNSLKIESAKVLKSLEEPYLEQFMYAYARDFISQSRAKDFFDGNLVFSELVKALPNLPANLFQKTTAHILKHADYIEQDIVKTALEQLIFRNPTKDTLGFLVLTPSLKMGKAALSLLSILDLSASELLGLLKESGFESLVSLLLDENGAIFYHKSVADVIDGLMRQGGKVSYAASTYLSTAVLAHNHKSSGTGSEWRAEGGARYDLSKIPKESELRFLSTFLNSKAQIREFDEDFTLAFERLWQNGAGKGEFRDEASAVLWRMLSGGDSPRFAPFAKYIEEIYGKSAADSGVFFEFLLYTKISAEIPVTQDDAERMKHLYKAQGIVTARTSAVINHLGLGGEFAADLIAFDWPKAEPSWLNVETRDISYEDFTVQEEQAAGEYTYVFDVGYVNVYSLDYTEAGGRVTRPVRRNLNDWQKALIFERAYEYLDGLSNDKAGFLLLAGRLCVDAGIFDLGILLEYISCMEQRPDMRGELSRALSYVLANQNSLTKAILYSPSSVTAIMKRFYSTCLIYWQDIKKQMDVRTFFAYVRSIERIAGKNKLNGISGYLHEEILRNPNIRPDLSEEYREYVR